jgi:cytochrome c6|uniref:cytochrome c553 n=1 Tax=Gonyostomum semen TaxID=375454 RepID=UPI00211546A3|nr:cytochrome c553 [Gonyostomum semen]UTE94437.1 cytochrome c553 [Gonyostomum semen]
MRKFSLNLLSLLGFTFLVLSQNSFAADIENGEKIFTANCSACHAGGNNVIMPEKTLKKDVLEANGMKSVDAITYQVTNGKNAMPAFGGRLSDSDIEDVANYVLSQSDKGWD